MSAYQISPAALKDLKAIATYIAEDSFSAAERWNARLIEEIQFLAKSPGLGRARKDISFQNILFWPVGSYLILYRVASNGIEVVAVTQGSRDLPRFLRRRGL